MKLFNRLIRYIKLHLFSNPRYFFNYLFRYFDPNFKLQINFFEFNEISSLLEEGKSIIRLGDGEIYIMNHGSLPFQNYEKELHVKIFDYIQSYNCDSPYIIGLNQLPLKKTNNELRQKNLLHCWLPSKIFFDLYFNKKSKYFDASLFYYHDTIPKYFESYFLTKTLVYVANQGYIEKMQQDKKVPFKNIEYIKTPLINAFAQYDSIKSEVEQMVKKVGKKDVVVLVAFGPAGKALAFELTKEGIQVIDVGQGIEVAYSDKNHIIAETLSVL